jgi:hypothetical protein
MGAKSDFSYTVSVSKNSRVGWAVVPVAVLLTCFSLSAQKANPRRPGADGRFASAVELTSKKGVEAKLPPHISTLLGLTHETECPVKQGVNRVGKLVRGIDVSTANKHDVVLLLVDESVNDQTLYLTSAKGTLRRIVSVKAGTGRVARVTPADRAAFEKEKQFWADRLAPASAAK